ncbi:hypothetical protein BZB76_0859 [Actinomadura pelletieri DSM 43383]|uniref:Uncharacterized protein n=1 Tax=Actinomadura pelletieri DSM 43383 TaxID=1120940 RepID=A0A495QZL8_9ACTN|nr:hypothetical protein [Actinomadura pelletieri]RKS79394.1 hypothetical protein BZB76_0859 [Actinomadura pelletieri DSM 43383]
MSEHHQAGGFDERAAERLLDGVGGDARLRALLTAAAAPARPAELAGEDAAVAAFLAAPRPARGSRAAALRRFLTIKVLAVVGGSLILTGGAAYATITGQLPGGRDPAPSPSPTINKREGTRGDATPATRLEPPAPTPKESPKPSPSRSTKKHGRDGAPGQQKKTKGPKLRPTRLPQTPPRGPGDNGKPPDAGTGNITTSGGGLGGGTGGGGMGGGAVGGGEGPNPPTTSGSGNQD